MSFLAEKCEIVSASRRRSASDCKGATVERVFGAVPMKESAADFETEVDVLACLARVEAVLSAVETVRTGRAGVGIATGITGAAGVIGAGVEKSSDAATGAGAEKSSGAETGAGAEKSSGAGI